MDRLDAMSTLIAAVDAGSLSAAARQLRTPLATVSRKISDLETHLGVRLLTRTSRKLAITEAGRAYVAAARRILDEVHDAERTASGEYTVPRGTLVVTAPLIFGRMHVLPVALEFLKTYPEINLKLVFTDRIAGLLDEHIDAAIRIGQLPDSSLNAASLGTVRRVVCGSSQYLSDFGVPTTLEDLADRPCITFEGQNSVSEWHFVQDKVAVSTPVRTRLAVNTAESCVDAALSGLGLTRVLSYQVAEHVRAKSLNIVLERFEPAPMPVQMVSQLGRLTPIKLRVFFDFAGPRLRRRLDVAEADTAASREAAGPAAQIEAIQTQSRNAPTI